MPGFEEEEEEDEDDDELLLFHSVYVTTFYPCLILQQSQ
jgi:hypothetical protein